MRFLVFLVAASLLATLPPLAAQPLPKSGVSGVDLVYVTQPSGRTRLHAVSAFWPQGPAAVPVGDAFDNLPSRWLHRRRTLGALEAQITWLDEGLALTPLGDGVGRGALHLVDFRGGGIGSVVVPTGQPASYDLAVSEALDAVFVAEDDGQGGTLLRGFSYATPGRLVPLSPATLSLPGLPSAHVTQMTMEPEGMRLHVPTTDGIHVVDLSSAVPQIALRATVSTAPAVPMTNVALCDRAEGRTLVCGTSLFDAFGDPARAGMAAWTSDGRLVAEESFGTIPGLSPPRPYVPAAGTTELAVVDDGMDVYAYFLLRDPSPTASFIRPSAVGVLRLLGGAAPALSTIVYPQVGGEPFAIPTVHGTRIAIESSQGPPFNTSPPDGGEPIAILYTPLDPLGAGTLDGHLSVPSPLGGRISTKGMDRPIWTHDGSRVVASTSHFPGAPNPGSPGIEVLNVPQNVPLNFHNPPHYVVPNLVSPHRTIIFPSRCDPRTPSSVPFLDGLTFVGSVFHNGIASIVAMPYGEIGQFQPVATSFVQSSNIPNFPAIHEPAFSDVTGSTQPVPLSFGARRTSWNVSPSLGLLGLVMSAAMEDEILIQATGWNLLEMFDPVLQGSPGFVRVPLGDGAITSSEILSL